MKFHKTDYLCDDEKWCFYMDHGHLSLLGSKCNMGKTPDCEIINAYGGKAQADIWYTGLYMHTH